MLLSISSKISNIPFEFKAILSYLTLQIFPFLEFINSLNLKIPETGYNTYIYTIIITILLSILPNKKEEGKKLPKFNGKIIEGVVVDEPQSEIIITNNQLHIVQEQDSK